VIEENSTSNALVGQLVGAIDPRDAVRLPFRPLRYYQRFAHFALSLEQPRLEYGPCRIQGQPVEVQLHDQNRWSANVGLLYLHIYL